MDLGPTPIPDEMPAAPVKLVARDGTQRGLHNKGRKYRHTVLLENIQAAVESQTGIKNWDPVVMMAVCAAKAWTGYPAIDENGQPIIDERGNPVMVPPDPALAVAAAAKVAPYVHSQLRPTEVPKEDADTDEVDIRQKTREMAEALGLDSPFLDSTS